MSYTALVYLSFGGPRGLDEVYPFLERVTAGRAVPQARLDEAAGHYAHYGGISPINGINESVISAVRDDFVEHSLDMAIYFGNRNGSPFIENALAQAVADGHTRILVFTTSAWGGYSGCRQYNEDIARAIAYVGRDDLVVRKLPQYWDHPLMVAMFADALSAAVDRLPENTRHGARIIFTAHSIPLSADATDGPPDEGGHRYFRQVHAAAKLVADKLGITDFDVVWQSRSGSKNIPWLEPDIADHIAAISAEYPAIVICPIGFVADHMEVVWDLDTEIRALAKELNIFYERAATPCSDNRFVYLIRHLVCEALAVGEIPVDQLTRRGLSQNGHLCAPQCCQR